MKIKNVIVSVGLILMATQVNMQKAYPVSVTEIEALKKRVNISVSGTGIVQHVSDSLEPATRKQTYAQGSMDLSLLSEPMKGYAFFMDIETQGGQSPDSSISNNSVLNSDIETLHADKTRLKEVWVQKTVFASQLQFNIGKIDLTSYFDQNRAANDETRQFVSGTLVNTPLLGNPPNGPGAAVYYTSEKGIAFGIGAQSAEAGGMNVTEQPYAIAELDIQSGLFFGQTGNYRFWSSRSGRTSEYVDDYAMGISADQDMGPNLVAFGRAARIFMKAPVRDPHAWSAGLKLHDFISQRRKDQFGLGYSHYLTAVGTSFSGEAESIGEAYYSIHVTDHLLVSPMAEYVFHSAGTDTGSPQSNILILGIRTQIYF